MLDPNAYRKAQELKIKESKQPHLVWFKGEWCLVGVIENENPKKESFYFDVLVDVRFRIAGDGNDDDWSWRFEDDSCHGDE